MRATAQCWLTDMDGVLVREEHALPGAAEFLGRLVERDRRFLVLTGSTNAADIEQYPFRPGRVLDSIADVVDLV